VDRRPLGKTGLLVSPIGFGAFKIGRNEKIKYPSAFELPDEAAAARLLNGVLDLGICYVDTAPAYGLSEARIGTAIAHRRDEFLLSTKVGEDFENGCSTYDFSAAAVRRSLERSLKRLCTEAVDIVFVHAHGDDEAILEQTDVVAVLQQARHDGLTRTIGFSGKTVRAAQKALAWADVLMVEYHSEDRSHAPVIAEAAECGVGIVVKKGLASGRLDPRAAIDHVLSTPGVGSLLIGSQSLEHLKCNVAYAVQTLGGPNPRARRSMA